MSVRHRAIAGAPVRSASEATQVLLDIIGETLGGAAALDEALVEHELEQARSAVRMLVAGEHLRAAPLILDANPLRVELTVTTGNAALGLEETTGKVPGAATATNWALHLSAPAPLTDWIIDAVAGLDHVSTEPVPAHNATRTTPLQAADIDIAALRRVAGET